MEMIPEHPVVPENSHFAEVPTNEGGMSRRHRPNWEGSPDTITEAMGCDPQGKVRTYDPMLPSIRK